MKIVISVYGQQLLSTLDNFQYTFRSTRYSFIASYDTKNELKTAPQGATKCDKSNDQW